MMSVNDEYLWKWSLTIHLYATNTTRLTYCSALGAKRSFCVWSAALITWTHEQHKSSWAPYERSILLILPTHRGPTEAKRAVTQWPLCTAAYSEHDLPSVLIGGHGSLLRSHWHRCHCRRPFPFHLNRWGSLLAAAGGKKNPCVTGHNMASQLSIWLMCAAWIQATALVVEAPSHSPWIHIAAHILLLLWCNCFVIAAQTRCNMVSI